MIPLRRTCKEVTRLVLLAEEQQALPLADRIAVRLHLLACHACPRFLRQLQLMRRATERWRRYSEE
ncbi:zf-HC2 domain-containing protein [Roseateles violae]|uniref:anti-sigma factor family protein n=1 Tax=Roseateles violae TaxID=3058042 RepID=UPI0025B4A617|nr:zf-HC2 domain-containing protein [Pelomonas sp. PFR6]